MIPAQSVAPSSVLRPPSGWSEIPTAELPRWNLRLSENERASIRQYPLYNERFRNGVARPVYLKFIDDRGVLSAFACLISFGAAPLKCGVVIDGPVPLDCGTELGEAVRALATWFRSRGFAFVRFSHRDKTIVDQLMSAPAAVLGNPLPFVPRYGGQLVVPLKRDDSEMLAGFQPIARRDIKKAGAAHCRIGKSEEFNEFRHVWPLYASRARQKGFRLGSLKGYESMFRQNPRKDLVRVYTAYYADKPVYSALFLKESSTVHYLIGALDRAALRGQPTPSCFLHWEAMRAYRDLGCKWYSLGGRSGSVYAFKKKFRPAALPSPTSVTLVLRPTIYRMWTSLGQPLIHGLARAKEFVGSSRG